MEITLDRFKGKPVMHEVLGEEMPIPPLKTKYYTSLLKSQFIETKILSKGLNGVEPSSEELEEKSKIDREIAFSVLSDICPDMTQEFFDNEVPAVAINEILAGTIKASGLTDEKMDGVREKFNRLAKLKEKERNDAKKSTPEKDK